MNKKISLGAAIAFMFIVAAATFCMTTIYSMSSFNQKVSDLTERSKMKAKYDEIDTLVRQKYYGTINENQLMDSIAWGYLGGIGDSYASYISADEYARMNQTGENAIVGIGAVLSASPEGYLLVGEVYPDSPAQTFNIEEGDLIIKIDDVDLTTENSESMLSAMNAPVGTTVNLVVRKGSEDMSVEITRREVVIPTVYSSMIPDSNVGYIIITEFTDSTANQFNRELNKLQNAGCKALIFDLRDNPGGIVSSATRILDRILPAGTLVSSIDKYGNEEQLFSSDTNMISLPVVTLINKGTVSAAELFVQVLRDYETGSAVGVATAGKAMMQETIKLGDGSAVNLTVAQYVTPSHTDFNDVGIKPDYEVTMESMDWKQLDHTTDPQLIKAIEVVTAMTKVADNKESSAETSE